MASDLMTFGEPTCVRCAGSLLAEELSPAIDLRTGGLVCRLCSRPQTEAQRVVSGIAVDVRRRLDERARRIHDAAQGHQVPSLSVADRVWLRGWGWGFGFGLAVSTMLWSVLALAAGF